MVDEQFLRDAAENGAVALNQENVSREVAGVLSRIIEAVDALTTEELVEALVQAIPRARRIAATRAASGDA